MRNIFYGAHLDSLSDINFLVSHPEHSQHSYTFYFPLAGGWGSIHTGLYVRAKIVSGKIWHIDQKSPLQNIRREKSTKVPAKLRVLGAPVSAIMETVAYSRSKVSHKKSWLKPVYSVIHFPDKLMTIIRSNDSPWYCWWFTDCWHVSFDSSAYLYVDSWITLSATRTPADTNILKYRQKNRRLLKLRDDIVMSSFSLSI